MKIYHNYKLVLLFGEILQTKGNIHLFFNLCISNNFNIFIIKVVYYINNMANFK